MSDASAETIAAIATAAGMAGVGVLRVSGPQVPVLAAAWLGRPPRPRYAHYTRFYDAQGVLIDQGLLLYFPAPSSYTGEHVLELQGHGNPMLLDLLLRHLYASGVRLARPGEFTERAFLNGKLDLAQAEAVADLIAARSQAQARAALRSMEGVFSQRVQTLRQALITLRVHIEAAIDFPQEEIDWLSDAHIEQQLHRLREQLHDLLRQARGGVRLSDGLSVVIIGRPNVGKSSLLNALAGDERAIVTAVAGTTRDLLREELNVDGMLVELTDTAGLRETNDPVEREGVRRAHERLQRADAVLLVSEQAQVQDDLILLDEAPREAARLVVINKIDRDGLPETVQQRDGISWLWLSANSGAGLDALREQLKTWAGGEDAEGAFSARRRHVQALQCVAQQLERAATIFTQRHAGELVAEELRHAQQTLGEITGDYSSDDLLGAIFGSFCIGK